MTMLQAALVVCALSAPAGGNDAVLLDFTASWCGPCRQMQPTVERLAAQGYSVRQVDIDREPQLAAQYRVTGVPCFVMVVGSRETGRIVGATSYEQLAGMFGTGGAVGGSHIAAVPGSGVRAAAPNVTAQPRLLPAYDSVPLGAGRGAALPTAATAAPSSPTVDPALLDRLLASTVRIRINDGDGNSVGTGTIVDAREGEALVLTCGHIFRDSKGQGRVTVDLYGDGAPQKIPARVIGFDLESDVGFLSFRPDVAVTTARIAPAGYAAKPGDTVVSVGCNHGDDATTRVSRVTTIDKFLGPPNLQVAGQPVQGRSGGGLFNAAGQVIGVCNAADPADDEGLYAALPAIHAELNQWALTKFCFSNEAPIAAAPPAFPAKMPSFGSADPHAHTVPTTSTTPAAAGSMPTAVSEQALASELAGLEAGAEVVCIIRSLVDPRAKSRVVVLDRASPEFLAQLQSDRSRQDARVRTSYEEPVAPVVATEPSAAAPTTDRAGPAWRPTWKRPGA